MSAKISFKPVISASMLLASLCILAPVSSQTAESKAYFLHIQGRALPLKQVLVNGVNVLGGAVISLSLPVNISGYTRAGLNTVQVDFVSDPKTNLLVTIEKRTPGPKSEDLAKISADANQSNGELKSTNISFNLPDDGAAASVGDLKEVDKNAIAQQFEHYYRALASTHADQVRALYRQSLSEERKLCPESARFFENVLNREVVILKNKRLKLNPLQREGLAFKVEGDVVKLYRQDAKPLIESNEVDAQVSPILIEVGKEKPNQIGSRTQPQAIEIPTTAFRSEKDGEIQMVAGMEEIPSKPQSVITTDGTVAATEITIGEESTVFDGSKLASDKAVIAKPNKPTSLKPVKTSVKERLVRFNLYFKPSKPDASGNRTWVVSLPPNV